MTPVDGKNMTPMMWVVLALLGVNGVGTFNTSQNVQTIKASMLEDVELRRWVEDGAVKRGALRQDVDNLRRDMDRYSPMLGERAAELAGSLQALSSAAAARMDRIAEQHKIDIAGIDARLLKFGVYIADLMRVIGSRQEKLLYVPPPGHQAGGMRLIGVGPGVRFGARPAVRRADREALR